MVESTVLMGSFQDLDHAVETLDRLRAFGIADKDITIVSSLPHSHKVMGRPEIKTKLPLISMASAVAGLLVGLLITIVTPNLYVIHVGGQAVVPIPPTAVLVYEFTMLFLILGTFLGVVILNSLPAPGPQYEGPALTDDRIGLLFQCPPGSVEEARALLASQGAENIYEPERREP